MDSKNNQESATLNVSAELGPVVPELSGEDKILSDTWEQAVYGVSLDNTDVQPNKAEEVVGTNSEQSDGVFSIKTRREVDPDAPKGIVSQQLRDFEKNIKSTPSDNLELETVDENFEKKEVSPDFEKAKERWKEFRDKSNAKEAEFNEIYHKHILRESKGWRGFANLPRKMFGLEPELTQQLKDLKGESQALRYVYKDAAKSLKDLKLNKEGDRYAEDSKVVERYQRMLAYRLTTSVYKERLNQQKQAVDEAWGENKLRPAIEALHKNKKPIMFAAVGAAALSGGLLPVAAAIGAGVGTRFALGTALNATYVKDAKNRLDQARNNLGEDFFTKSFFDDEKIMEQLFVDVGAREVQAKTVSNIAGVAAGIGAAGYVGSLGQEVMTDLPVIEPAPLPETPEVSFEQSTTTGVVEDISPVNESLSETTPDVQNISESTPETIANPSVYDIAPVEQVVARQAEAVVNTDVPNVQTEVIPENPSSSEVSETAISETEIQVEENPERAEAFETETSMVLHTVESGDNVWNIMEGKGSDSNPVGGKSEVLEGMSLIERQNALDKLIEYAENNPEFAKEVGAVRSEGNINKIYPGEQINVSILDEKLRELLNIEAPINEDTIIESAPEESINQFESQDDDHSLYQSENQNTSVVDQYSPNTVTPSEESISYEVNFVESLNRTVGEVERASGFIFSRPDVSGTFEILKDYNFGEIKSMAMNGSYPEGVSTDGFERWTEYVNEAFERGIETNDNESLGSYVNRVVMTQVTR